MPDKIRCGWCPTDKADYVHYHDTEWGVPLHDDRDLFEMIILEGAQAGLSWYTILKRRDGYKHAFHNFDIQKCANFTDDELEEILKNANIIKNRLKVFSVRKNALGVLKIKDEFGSFDNYLWQFVDYNPILNRPQNLGEINAKTALSDKISKDLKKRGFSFVGSTIIYAFMQAVGMVNDHTKDCFLYSKIT